MAFFSSSSSRITFLTRSLFFLPFSSRLIHYNMTHTTAYIPVHAFRKIDIQSILNIALPLLKNEETERRFDYHHSRRTMLYFLLSMQMTTNNEQLIDLIKECRPNIDWSRIRNDYEELKKCPEPYQKYYRAEKFDTYWEKQKLILPGPKQSLKYISKYRDNHFQPDELKLYWNYEQIRTLNQSDHFNPVTDNDTHKNLNNFPVNTRQNQGEIKFIQSGIEEAVFQIPEDKQIIVLDFADERMPGGYFLENARTQEEVILFNSDGYQAILDLKYQVMDGGYMLPEYGVAYVKRVRFFKKGTDQERTTDLIIAACYDLSGMGEGIHKTPSHAKPEELRHRTFEKFQAIIAAAVANTEGNGENTYLLLGPIGTGAFANDMKMIAKLFADVLNNPLMGSKQAIRHAFKEIWFVSIDELNVFAKEFAQ